MAKISHSAAYLLVAAFLDAGYRGTYGDLGRRTRLHQRAVGSTARKYARLNPAWEHRAVVSLRTGEPAYA